MHLHHASSHQNPVWVPRLRLALIRHHNLRCALRNPRHLVQALDGRGQRVVGERLTLVEREYLARQQLIDDNAIVPARSGRKSRSTLRLVT